MSVLGPSSQEHDHPGTLVTGSNVDIATEYIEDIQYSFQNLCRIWYCTGSGTG